MTIVDVSGNPLKRSVPAVPQKRMDGDYENRTRLGTSSVFPYRAAEIASQELGADWFPTIRSADSEVNRFRDRMVGRGRDLVRNDGFAKGAVDRILDNVIGGHVRLSSMPDYRALAHISGKNFDATWADTFRRAVEARWRIFSESPGHYNDVARQLTISQQFRLAARHLLIDGENILLSYWLPERVGIGGADYATAFQVVDPDLLSNPFAIPDNSYMRSGVEIDDYGVPVAYHLRKAHQFDWYDTDKSMQWERIEREDEDGWRRVIHDYDRDRAGQHRGLGLFTPILPHAKMLAKYYGVELQAATLGAIFGTYISTEQDPALMEEIIGGGEESELGALQDFRGEYYSQNPVMLNGVRMPMMAPGDKINTVSSAHPHQNFNDFAREMHRLMAAGIGVSAEQLSQTWSEMNYSSARASMLEIWKTMDRRSKNLESGTYTPVFATWLRESFERGDYDEINPRGAPSYAEAMYAYSRCSWLGPGRGWIDPVKEPQGSTMAMDAGLTTLRRECAAQGRDWEEELEQRAIEIDKCKKLNIPPPAWAQYPAVTAARPEEKPEAE